MCRTITKFDNNKNGLIKAQIADQHDFMDQINRGASHFQNIVVHFRKNPKNLEKSSKSQESSQNPRNPKENPRNLQKSQKS